MISLRERLSYLKWRAVILMGAVFIVLGANAAFGSTGALVFDGAPSGPHPSGFDPTFAGEQQ